MNIEDMIGNVFLTSDVRDKSFFLLKIPTRITDNHTLVHFKSYLFIQGKGLRNIQSHRTHITVFNDFSIIPEEKYFHKIITIMFGGVW